MDDFSVQWEWSWNQKTWHGGKHTWAKQLSDVVALEDGGDVFNFWQDQSTSIIVRRIHNKWRQKRPPICRARWSACQVEWYKWGTNDRESNNTSLILPRWKKGTRRETLWAQEPSSIAAQRDPWYDVPWLKIEENALGKIETCIFASKLHPKWYQCCVSWQCT